MMHLCGSDLFDKVRLVVKALKGDRFKEFFRSYKIPKPTLDVNTRWNSTFAMVESLQKIRPDMEDYYSKFPSMEKGAKLNDEEWESMKQFQATYKPAFACTLKLQTVQMTLSKLWLLKSVIVFY